MLSEFLVDRELKPFLARLPTSKLSEESLPGVRAAMNGMLAKASTVSATRVRVESHQVPGPVNAPPVRVVSYRPDDADGSLPGLLHVHGGGYILGAPEMADAINRRLASELGCAIFSVGYRLAPETRFPGQLEDCYAALLWLTANARRLSNAGIEVELHV